MVMVFFFVLVQLAPVVGALMMMVSFLDDVEFGGRDAVLDHFLGLDMETMQVQSV